MRRLPLHAALLLMSGPLLSLGGCQPSGDPAVPTAGSKPEEAQLQRASAPAEGDVERPADHVTHWQCGDLRVSSQIDARDGGATLHISGRQLQLPLATPSVSGRHLDGEGNAFVLRGRAATLTLSGDDARECTATDQPSPWYDAAMRGIAFRAVGSEPGWFVELGMGKAPTLRATLDYGERTIEAANMQARPGDGDPEFNGTSDGAAVVLWVHREACADGMSGEQFDARATLQVGASRYEGCGAFLSD